MTNLNLQDVKFSTLAKLASQLLNFLTSLTIINFFVSSDVSTFHTIWELSMFVPAIFIVAVRGRYLTHRLKHAAYQVEAIWLVALSVIAVMIICASLWFYVKISFLNSLAIGLFVGSSVTSLIYYINVETVGRQNIFWREMCLALSKFLVVYIVYITDAAIHDVFYFVLPVYIFDMVYVLKKIGFSRAIGLPLFVNKKTIPFFLLAFSGTVLTKCEVVAAILFLEADVRDGFAILYRAFFPLTTFNIVISSFILPFFTRNIEYKIPLRIVFLISLLLSIATQFYGLLLSFYSENYSVLPLKVILIMGFYPTILFLQNIYTNWGIANGHVKFQTKVNLIIGCVKFVTYLLILTSTKISLFGYIMWFIFFEFIYFLIFFTVSWRRW